ncbi:MAG TPA: OmpA family protein [Flavobacteriaceae bacterium]|nr:OmpA family protein [Flavobacteriaceae bacterium]
MAKRIIFLLSFVFLNHSLCLTQERRHEVYFETDIYRIAASEKDKLSTFISKIDTSAVQSITIYGFCDDRGTKQYNLVLSNNRANSVKKMFLNYAIPQEKITTISGKGEIPLKTTKKTEIPKERQSNRKVDILITFKNENTETYSANKNKILVIKGYPNDNINLLKGELNVGDKIRFENLYFEIGYSFLVPQSKKELEKIAAILVERKNIFFTIEGHVCCTNDDSDAIDRKTKKRNLSIARAKYIYDYLAKKGVEKYRMKYKGMERKFPLGGHPKYDRRVEFLITYSGE